MRATLEWIELVDRSIVGLPPADLAAVRTVDPPVPVGLADPAVLAYPACPGADRIIAPVDQPPVLAVLAVNRLVDLDLVVPVDPSVVPVAQTTTTFAARAGLPCRVDCWLVVLAGQANSVDPAVFPAPRLVEPAAPCRLADPVAPDRRVAIQFAA